MDRQSQKFTLFTESDRNVISRTWEDSSTWKHMLLRVLYLLRTMTNCVFCKLWSFALKLHTVTINMKHNKQMKITEFAESSLAIAIEIFNEFFSFCRQTLRYFSNYASAASFLNLSKPLFTDYIIAQHCEFWATHDHFKWVINRVQIKIHIWHRINSNFGTRIFESASRNLIQTNFCQCIKSG
jgi:hypothetical protein